MRILNKDCEIQLIAEINMKTGQGGAQAKDTKTGKHYELDSQRSKDSV